MMLRFVALSALCATTACAAGAVDRVSLETASAHPMQYYLSLPNAWSEHTRWPVVIVIESANRQFESTAERFAEARRGMPFIIAAPLVVTNGGAGYRQVPTYRYADSVWAEVERAGGCTFDVDGIAAVASDIRKRYGGEDRYFLTGWEAGGHTVWALLFHHPDNVRAVAATSTNYAGRCLEDGAFSSAPVRTDLPVHLLGGALDPGWKPGQPLFEQSQRAKQTAEQHGFRNLSEQIVPGKGHEPLADAVLEYFYSIWRQSRPS
jgi:dienelactone hydrolase